MKIQRRRDRNRPGPEPALQENGNGLDDVVAEQAVTEYEVTSNGHEQTEVEGVSTVAASTSSATGSTILLPKRKRRLASAPAAPSRVESEDVSRTVIAPGGTTTARTRTTTTTVTRETRVEPRTDSGFTWRNVFTYENLIWASIFALAIFTRLWDIGNRGIHHDESLHAVFSHTLYKGGGYIHDPMMHGPLQFHMIAAMYWLFGATDATARLASAFCGIFVVMSPFFLRAQMGRLTALICSFLLLVSPSILYFSRMAREDAIFSGMEMLMIVGLWRFISMRRPADFYIFCAGLSLMFTIKETAFLTVAVLAIFFLLLFALQSGYAIMAAVGGYLASIGGMYLMLHGGMKDGTIPQLPNIPQVSPGYDVIIAFIGGLFGHPLVQWALIITAIFGALIVTLFRLRARQMVAAGEDLPLPTRTVSLPSRRVRPRIADDSTAVAADGSRGNGQVATQTTSVEVTTEAETDGAAEMDRGVDEASPLWDPRSLEPKSGTILSRYEPGSLPHLIGALFARPSVLLIGFIIAATMFTVLYTVFFTDMPRGIVSGLFGSVGYWMAQQGVERGGQPWFFYLLLIPLYEPIAVFFSIAAGIFFSWRGVRRVLATRAERFYEGTPGMGAFNVDRPAPFARFESFMPMFLGCWLLGVLFIYSWAGEKMPWLMVHMVRPAIFLASLFIGALVVSLIARRRERLEEAGLLEDDPLDNRPPLRGRALAGGAMFSLAGARHLAQQVGLAPRSLATQAVSDSLPSNTVYSMNGGRRSRTNGPVPPPSPRRQSRSRSYEQVAVRVQDPPWVAWSRPGSWAPIVLFLSVFTLLTMAWALRMNALIATSTYTDWAMTWVYPLLMLALLALFIVWIGVGRALRYFALGILTAGLIYQFRSAVMLTYHQPDVPKEMAVYVQTSPDVTRVMRELEAYANVSAGGKKDFKVIYDSFTSWPMEWYLRDYNKQFIAEAKAEPAADQRVLLLEYAQHNSDQDLLQNYVAQRYAMRWWFPEEWYKSDFLPGLNTKTTPFNQQVGGAFKTTWQTISEPQLQGTLWKYLMFREPPKPLGSEDMTVFIRKDAAQQYRYIQYPPPRSFDLPVQMAPAPVQTDQP